MGCSFEQPILFIVKKIKKLQSYFFFVFIKKVKFCKIVVRVRLDLE